MRDDPIDIFKIMEFLIVVDIFFQYFSSNWKFTTKENFKNDTINQLDFLLRDLYIFRTNCQIRSKAANSVKN